MFIPDPNFVHPGSWIRILSIPDPNFVHPGSCIRILSIADPGSEFYPSRIPDPNFFHPGSESKNLSILTPKNCFQAFGNLIWVVHPGSGSWPFTHTGSRSQKGTGSRIRIRNTGTNISKKTRTFFLDISGSEGASVEVAMPSNNAVIECFGTRKNSLLFLIIYLSFFHFLFIY